MKMMNTTSMKEQDTSTPATDETPNITIVLEDGLIKDVHSCTPLNCTVIDLVDTFGLLGDEITVINKEGDTRPAYTSTFEANTGEMEYNPIEPCTGAVQFDDELKLAQSLIDGAFLKCPETDIVLRYSNGAFEDDDGHIHRLIDYVEKQLVRLAPQSLMPSGHPQRTVEEIEKITKGCREFIENALQTDYEEFHDEPFADKWYLFSRVTDNGMSTFDLHVFWADNKTADQLTVRVYPFKDGETQTDDVINSFLIPVTPYLA